MNFPRVQGRYQARLAQTPADMAAARALRALAFEGLGATRDVLEADPLDALCRHVLIERSDTGEAVCAFRMMLLEAGHALGQSYSAQFYDLRALMAYPRPMLELGRFCIHPERADPDILRVAWGALTWFVDHNDVALLMGCSSFTGTNAAPYAESLALLAQDHLAPSRWAPRVKAPEVLAYAQDAAEPVDRKAAQAALPPLLRTYLLMGGWVSDHAVIDRQMNTLHVFTGLGIDAIPPARKRLLRADAQMLDGAEGAG